VQGSDLVDPEKLPACPFPGLTGAAYLIYAKQLLLLLTDAIRVRFHNAMTPVVSELQLQSLPNSLANGWVHGIDPP
jgi:hypothetical protein